MVVTPSTSMASADFCPPERDRSPRIRCDNLPLTLAAFTYGCFDPFWTSLSHASSSGTLCLPTQFLFIQSRFCSPASSPRSLTLTQLLSASGSSSQRPQETFTPKLSPMPGVHNTRGDFSPRVRVYGQVLLLGSVPTLHHPVTISANHLEVSSHRDEEAVPKNARGRWDHASCISNDGSSRCLTQ